MKTRRRIVLIPPAVHHARDKKSAEPDQATQQRALHARRNEALYQRVLAKKTQHMQEIQHLIVTWKSILKDKATAAFFNEDEADRHLHTVDMAEAHGKVISSIEEALQVTQYGEPIEEAWRQFEIEYAHTDQSDQVTPLEEAQIEACEQRLRAASLEVKQRGYERMQYVHRRLQLGFEELERYYADYQLDIVDAQIILSAYPAQSDAYGVGLARSLVQLKGDLIQKMQKIYQPFTVVLARYMRREHIEALRFVLGKDFEGVKHQNATLTVLKAALSALHLWSSTRMGPIFLESGCAQEGDSLRYNLSALVQERQQTAWYQFLKRRRMDKSIRRLSATLEHSETMHIAYTAQGQMVSTQQAWVLFEKLFQVFYKTLKANEDKDPLIKAYIRSEAVVNMRYMMLEREEARAALKKHQAKLMQKIQGIDWGVDETSALDGVSSNTWTLWYETLCHTNKILEASPERSLTNLGTQYPGKRSRSFLTK